MNKRTIRIIAIVVGILIVIAIAVPFLVDVNSFRPKLEGELTSALGRQVKVGNLSLSIFSGTCFRRQHIHRRRSGVQQGSVCDREVAQSRRRSDPAGLLQDAARHRPYARGAADHAAEVGEREAGTSPASAATRRRRRSLHRRSRQRSRVSLRAVHSRWTSWPSPTAVCWWEKPTLKPHIYDKVNIEVTNFSPTAQFPFTLTAALPGGGDVSLNGKCGPINAGNAAATPFEATIKVRKLDLAASGFVEASSGIQGIADFDGTINSNGQRRRAAAP